MKQVGKNLAQDDFVSDSQLDDRLNTFVDDVQTVESAIARIHRVIYHFTVNILYFLQLFLFIKKNVREIVNTKFQVKTISELQTSFGGFQWLYYFKTCLPEADSTTLDSDTQVIVRTPKILKAISDLFVDNTFSKRQLNNYLVWRLVYSLLQDLPYRYNHLWLQWSEQVKGRTVEYRPIWQVCFRKTVKYMGDAMGGLFASYHFTHYDKNELTTMVDNLRTSVINEVKNLDWMQVTFIF